MKWDGEYERTRRGKNMPYRTKINPIIGCSKISPGCANCYAERMAKRQKAMGTRGYADVVDENGWTGKTAFVPSELKKPYRWKKPRKIFTCSMTDLFHESVPVEWLDTIFRVAEENKRHTFQILTKRILRMAEYIEDYNYAVGYDNRTWLDNVWLGATVATQEEVDRIAPTLVKIKNMTGCIVFLSIEPMLGEIDLRAYIHGGLFADPREIGSFYRPLDWVICGGESGPGARPMHPEWVRGLRYQCQSASVPFFFKQWGEWGFAKPGEKYYDWRDDIGFRKIGKQKAGRILDGRTWDEFPTAEDVRNRRKK